MEEDKCLGDERIEEYLALKLSTQHFCDEVHQDGRRVYVSVWNGVCIELSYHDEIFIAYFRVQFDDSFVNVVKKAAELIKIQEALRGLKMGEERCVEDGRILHLMYDVKIAPPDLSKLALKIQTAMGVMLFPYHLVWE